MTILGRSGEILYNRQYISQFFCPYNDGDNMSDHLAISCTLPVSVLPNVLKLKKESVWKPMWEKSNLDYYKTVLSNNLSCIDLPVDASHCTDKGCHIHYPHIERYYHDIVQCLKLADITCVPTFRVDFHNHCFPPVTRHEKKQFIDITNLWTHVEKPVCGVINAEKLR